MLLTKEVEVKVNSSTIKHYESLGYQIPMRKASKSIFQHTGREFAYDLNNIILAKTNTNLINHRKYNKLYIKLIHWGFDYHVI